MSTFLLVLFSPLLALFSLGIAIVIRIGEMKYGSLGSGALAFFVGGMLSVVGLLVGLAAAAIGASLFGPPAVGFWLLGGYCVTCWIVTASIWIDWPGGK
jgi:hypothetical protein